MFFIERIHFNKLKRSVFIIFAIFFIPILSNAQNISERFKAFDSDRVWSDEKIKYYLEEANPEAIQGEDLLKKGANYLFFGQIDEALEYFKRYLEVDPNNLAVINLVGVCYNLDQEYDSALVYLDKVAKEFPANAELYCERGWVKVMMGDTLAGGADIYYAYKLDSTSYVVTYNLALFQIAQAKLDSSVLMLRRARRLSPDLIQPLVVLGEVYSLKGDHEKSIDYYDSVISLDTSFIGIYLLRGMEYLEMYELDNAINDFKKIDLLSEDSSYFHLHITMHILKDYRKAIFYYRKWIETDTNSITKDFFKKVDGNEFTALLETVAVDSVNEGARFPSEVAHAMYHICDFEYDTSYLLMREYLEDHPDDVIAGRIFMLSQYQRGDVEGAEKTINSIVELDTNLVYANAMKADMMERQGDYRGSLKYSRRALNEGPGYFWALNIKAWALFMLGRYEEAINACDIAIGIDPDLPNTYNTRGLSLNAVRQLDRAEKDFRKALDLNPDFCFALGNLAMVLVNKENYNAAAFYAKKAVNQCPDLVQGYNQRARIYMHLKMPELALADRDRIIELEPDNPENYYVRGNIYLEMQEEEKAVDDFKKAISLNPEIIWTYLRLGSVYLRQRKYDEAEKLFIKAIEIDPGHEFPYTSLGFICRERYDNKNSKKWFKKALEINPDNDYALAYLGYIELLTGDYNRSYDYFQRAYNVEKGRGDRQFLMTDKLQYLIREDVKADKAKKILKEIYGLDE